MEANLREMLERDLRRYSGFQKGWRKLQIRWHVEERQGEGEVTQVASGAAQEWGDWFGCGRSYNEVLFGCVTCSGA
eukprot:scaffold712_cov404-Prasinococcus_capsulatus_cf.AAC.8